MPVPPGYSVTDLINAAKFCVSVFDAFFDKYDNAPARLRELAQLINTFHEILDQNQAILERRNTPFPGHEGLKRTLEECQSFIKKFKYACDSKGHGAKKVISTAKFPAYHEKVADLDRQLMRHALPMLLWNSNTLLKSAFEQGEEVPPIPQPDVPLGDDTIDDEVDADDTDYGNARAELDRFRREMAEFQAKMPRPLQRHVRRTMFFREFHSIVRRHWNNLDLPADELLDIFGGNDPEPDEAPTEAEATTHHSSGSILVEIKRCEVTIRLGGADGTITCIGFRVQEDDTRRRRVILWYDEAEVEVMRHYVPFQTHPHTYHAVHRGNLRQVSFLTKQDIFVSGLRIQEDPTYAFSTESDCRSFQRFVRNRELLGVFDINTIDSDIGELAKLQQLKIWRMHGADNQPTLSFFADLLDTEQEGVESDPAAFFEAHLRWFESIPRLDAPRVLRLVLNKNNEAIRPQSQGRRFSLRRLSSSKTSPTLPRSLTSVQYAHLLYDSINEPLYAQEDAYGVMKYLEIEFIRSSDLHRFIRTSRNAHPRNNLGSQSNLPLAPSTPSSPSIPRRSSARSSSAGAPPSGEAHMAVASSSPFTLPTPALTERSDSVTESSASAPRLSVNIPQSIYDFRWEFDKPGEK